MDEMSEGVIAYWHPDPHKGFGFVCDVTDPTTRIFCHIRHVPGFESLSIGQRLRYTPGVNPRTAEPMAVNCKLLPPIISQPSPPRVSESDLDDAEHALFAQQPFLRRSA